MTVIYTPTNFTWKPFGNPRLHRPFDSVILDRKYIPFFFTVTNLLFSLTDSIHADVTDFLENPGWYLSRGIPYRRGYLLHGPPGCGKSSYIQALAGMKASLACQNSHYLGKLGYGICVLSLSDRKLTDDMLNLLLVSAPERTFILLEVWFSHMVFTTSKSPRILMQHSMKKLHSVKKQTKDK